MDNNDIEFMENKPESTAEKEMDSPATFASKQNNSKDAKKKEEKISWQKSVLLYLHDLVVLLAVVVIVFLLLFRVVVVSGTSMNTTLLDGDYLLLAGRIFYSDPKQGDIIVASKESFENGAPIVKRVIATEGQWVDIDFVSGIVYVGDSSDDLKPLDEPYVLTPTNVPEGVAFPLQVQENCIFVMGDNRNDSKDSRNPEIGQIKHQEVLGKVIFLFFPGNNGGKFERDFARIGVVS
ncbi:MAG: signal peptidase I [Oscillospiraceae bacterium]|nr:signal peptidase I [Oscillospiraceae bacterium]